MNEIVILETAKGYSLEADLKLLEDTLKLEIENARAVKPTPENEKLCVKEITKLRKTFNDYSEKLASAEQPYVDSLEVAVKPIVTLLNEFGKQIKDYQSEVLNVKKQSRADKAKEIYSKVLGSLLQDGSLDGEAPKFEEVYLPSYYNLTNEALEAVLKENIQDSLKRQKAVGKVATFVFEGEKIAQAEKLLTEHGWVKDKDFKEEIL